jgi:translation initiation factor IF-1
LGDGESGIRLGEPRVWRSDEWGTLTPLCFRQQYNTLGAYNRYSQTLGSILTDNMLVYGQPSWDILTLFRPFYWGYLFFGSERGLSWFWCSRLIVLFLSWFELGMLITDGQKKLSVMLSVCVSFAPFLQWWFAINGLVEMLIYGACFVLGSNYLVSRAFNPRKIAVAVGMAVCAVGYVLTFYPTWMVPVAWGFVPLFLWVVIWKFNRNVLRRVDVVPWLLIFVITAAGLTVLAVTSWDVIKAELNSVYPGNAPSSSGGTGLWWMMKYPISLVSRFSMNELIVENSSIICFAPAGVILALWVIIKEKKKDPLLILLLGMNLFLAWYYCVGIPKWLAKILLLSFVNSNRGPQVLGFLRLTLFGRAVALKEKAPKRWLAALAAVISSAIPMRLALGFTKYEPGGLRYEYFDTAEKIVVVWAILAVVFYLLYRARKSKYTMAVLGVCAVVLASSIWINPVAKGVPEITKSETMKQIRDLVKEDPQAIWLVADMAYPATNIPAMAGADCLNTTQTYPQKTRWEMLNQEGECEDIYNRYCHIRASLGSKTMLELVSTDYVEVTLSPEDLKKLNIRYIVSTNDFDERIAVGTTNIFTDSGIELQKYYEGAQLSIYRCVY